MNPQELEKQGQEKKMQLMKRHNQELLQLQQEHQQKRHIIMLQFQNNPHIDHFVLKTIIQERNGMLQWHQMEKQLLENQQEQRKRENNYEIEKISVQTERKRQQDIENERKMQMMQQLQREQQEKKRLEHKLSQQQQLLTKLKQKTKQHEWQDEIASFFASTPTPATPHSLQLQQANTEMQQSHHYQHPQGLQVMSWMPLSSRGQIDPVFSYPTCGLSLPQTNHKTQLQPNFTCNEYFNNLEAERKFELRNDTSETSQSSSGQVSDNPHHHQYQHQQGPNKMSLQLLNGGHQPSTLPRLQGIPEQPQPVRPPSSRGQIDPVFFYPTCGLSLPETNPETQLKPNFSCNEYFNNLEAEVKTELPDDLDTSEAS